jgi:hypothetical protein
MAAHREPTRTAASYFTEVADAVTLTAVGACSLNEAGVAVAVSAVSFDEAGAPFAAGADPPDEVGVTGAAGEVVCVEPGRYVFTCFTDLPILEAIIDADRPS